jgi:hypothetical protein
MNQNENSNSDSIGDDGSSDAVGSEGELIDEEFIHNASLERTKTPSQYLVVLDNSSSMAPFAAKVTDGFNKIPRSIYPEKSEIAVMTSMVSEYGNPKKPHAGINKYTDIEKEPGFLDLVDKASIENFLASGAPAMKKDKYKHMGCDKKWFDPTDKNATGQSCIEAHLQNSMHGVGCEPGMHAFEQMVSNAPKNFFKEGHVLHVIFVSDEPGAGCNNAELKNKCPTLNELEDTANNNSKLVDVRFHGIINDSDSKGCNYANVIAANDGKMIPIKSAASKDYESVIESIASETKSDRATFTLKKGAVKIEKILVNGSEFEGKVFFAGNSLTLVGLPDVDGLRVQVTYFGK